MLDYIKQKLAEKQQEVESMQESTVVDPANVSSELLMEYAPIMEGLEELSLEGSGDPVENRPLINIPLAADDEDVPDSVEDMIANDPEIGKIEVDAATGNFTDTPIDANIQTEYASIKTMNDFIQESYDVIDVEMGMTANDYDAKVMSAAKENFIDYRNSVLQEQVNAFAKISLHSNAVEPAIMVEFAAGRTALLEPNYQVDENGNIRKKQLDTISVLTEGHVFERLTSYMTNVLQEQYGEMPEGKTAWSFLQPVSINVPIDPIDKFSAIVGLKNMLNMGKTEYVRCSVPVQESYNATEFVSVPAERVEMMNEVSCTKSVAIQESAKEDPEYQHIVQEAIDFGGNDNATPPEIGGQDTTNANPPTIDGSNGEAPSNDTQNAAPADNNKVSLPVETNDVSDQIAEKVATNTSVPAESQNADQTVNAMDNAVSEPTAVPTETPADTNPTDVAGADSTNDLTGDANVGSSDIEAQLGELDNIGSEANADGIDQADLSGATDMGDVGNMSMDEMIQAATDKIKGMPMNVIQKFLTGDETALQEAFIMQEAMVTSKNVNEQIDVNLRACLGVLNNDELSFKGIEKEFKKKGKTLNGILSKATKKKDVYSEEEIDDISKLNKNLTDLMVHFKPDVKGNVEDAKNRIKAFTSQSVKVDKIIKRHKKVNEKPAADKDEKKEEE